MTPINTSWLREGIEATFGPSELKILCDDLQIPYDDLEGDSKPEKVLALIRYSERRGQLHRLVEYVEEKRPNYPWHGDHSIPVKPAEPPLQPRATSKKWPYAMGIGLGLAVILFFLVLKSIPPPPPESPASTVQVVATIRSRPTAPDFDCTRVAPIHEQECEALKALYVGNGGSHWIKNSDWLKTLAPCTWYGVTCAGGHVTMLSLAENNLTSSIPPTLTKLFYLRELDLAGNHLGGEIPMELGGLPSLEVLRFSGNDLEGPIPSELGNLTRLQALSLERNILRGGIPTSFGRLVNLKSLVVAHNQLTGTIPAELGALAHLERLELNDNQLAGAIPSSLTNLTNLTSLDLGSNALVVSHVKLIEFLNTKAPDWRASQKPVPVEVKTDTWVNPKDGAVYIYIPAGAFMMGSDENDKLAEPQELPQHTVTLAGFWIMQMVVSNAQYMRCVDEGACSPPHNTTWRRAESANLPVSELTWYQAKAYAEWAGGRLPTEAEWEKSCRGTDGRRWPWGDNYDDSCGTRLNFGDSRCSVISWCSKTADMAQDDGYAEIAPVGSYPNGASPYGVLDLVGNAWEWTSSLHRPYPYVADDGRDDPEASGNRALRGGAYGFGGFHMRCMYRWDKGQEPEKWGGNAGLRVVSKGP